jgi:molybdopterin synthase sulfur carrier subunit
MIKVVFFAALREQLDCSDLSLPAAGITTINQLKTALINHQAGWQPYIENHSLLSAVNHEMVHGEHMIKSGDEVAFLPPVSGG